MSGCSAVQSFLVGVLSGMVSGAVAGGIYVCVLIERANESPEPPKVVSWSGWGVAQSLAMGSLYGAVIGELICAVATGSSVWVEIGAVIGALSGAVVAAASCRAKRGGKQPAEGGAR